MFPGIPLRKLASLREERIRTIEAYLSVGYVTNCCVHDRLVLNSFGRRRLQMKRDLGCICHAHNNPSRTQRTSKLLWCESFPPVGGLILPPKVPLNAVLPPRICLPPKGVLPPLQSFEITPSRYPLRVTPHWIFTP